MMHKNKKTSHKCSPCHQKRPSWVGVTTALVWPLSLKQQVTQGSSLSPSPKSLLLNAGQVMQRELSSLTWQLDGPEQGDAPQNSHLAGSPGQEALLSDQSLGTM